MSTDDAQVKQDIVSVSPQVNGQIVEVFVRNGARVKRGDVLFRIDPQPYRVALEQAQATLAAAKLQTVVLKTTAAGTGGDITGAEANLKVKQNALARQQALLKQGFTTRTDYDSAYPCEVSLSLPKSETSTPRIQFSDEPALITYAVTGKARPFRAAGSPILKSKVITLYGEEKNLPDIALSENFLSTGNIKYDVFPLHALGQFRVETWVENATGDRISSYNEIVVTRTVQDLTAGSGISFGDLGEHALKGVPDPWQLYRVERG